MGQIPQQTIEDVRSRVDIVELVGRYVALKKAGRNHLGLCPFHQEKTPSFSVNAERQAFYCFGCHEGGGAFDFLMRLESLSFPEAVRSLARDCGIEIAETDAGERGQSERLLAAIEVAQQLYRRSLDAPEGAPAREYLAARGLDRETADRCGVGFAPRAWDRVVRALEAASIPASIGERAGLIAERTQGGNGHYDRMRGRLVFPIADARGRIIGFGGRALFEGETAKYLNTPETPLFKKRDTLYGLDRAVQAIRERGHAVVCEGYFDQIALQRAGIQQAVATCGTALSSDHARQLRRRTRQVVLLFDGDEAGQRAAERSLEILLPEGLRVRAAALPVGEDPDSLLAARGPEALRELVDNAPECLELALRRAVARGIASPADKADVVSHLAPLVACVADPVERISWAHRVAAACDTSRGAVEAVVQRARRGQGAPAAELVEREASRPRSDPQAGEVRQLRLLTALLLRHPGLAQRHDRARFEAVTAPGPWRELVLRLIDESPADPLAIAEALEPEARKRLHEILHDDSVLDRESDSPPAQTLGEVLAWFDKRRLQAESRALTQRMRGSAADARALLADKQRQLEARRAAAGLDSGAAP